jgi:hypothetical protein
MSVRFQAFLLRNTTGLQHLINDRLATRAGPIGKFFKNFEIGARQMSSHSLGRSLKVANYFWMFSYQILAMMRTPLSRFIGNTTAPLNYSGLYMYAFVSAFIISRYRMIRARDVMFFNHQDRPEFWFSRYNMMFPPNFLHNRISAHYIEINHIFAVEMIKKYQVARREILADRDEVPEVERRSRYATNANYICEPMGPDDDKIQRARDDGTF